MDATMTDAQREALRGLCERYGVEFIEADFRPGFFLPDGWFGGTVGPIQVGVSPEGQVSS